MIDLKKDFPLKEEVIEKIALNNAQIRDLLTENEQLVRELHNERIYLTKPEVAAILRCTEEKIHPGIPKTRIGNNYLWLKEDVYEFLDSKKK